MISVIVICRKYFKIQIGSDIRAVRMSKSIGLALLFAFQVLHLEAKSAALEGRTPSLTPRVQRVGTGEEPSGEREILTVKFGCVLH